MRLKSLLAAMLALVAIVMTAPAPAEAGHYHRSDAPRGWGHERVVRHWIYYPRYHHRYYAHAVTDPYAYRYEPRGYYPYYNSGYWVPARCYHRCRQTYRLPPYYKAWGASKRHYHHRKWHHRHHGRIRHHHW